MVDVVEKTITVRAAATSGVEIVGLTLLVAGAVGVGLACWWAGCLVGGAILLGGSWLVSR